MRNDYCDYCGAEIDRQIDTSNQRFCCEEHRIDFHNTQRKALRKFQAIDRAVNDLYKMLEDENMQGLHGKIAQMIRNAQYDMTRPDYHGRIQMKCPNCELRSVTGDLICECGSQMHYERYWKPE